MNKLSHSFDPVIAQVLAEMFMHYLKLQQKQEGERCDELKTPVAAEPLAEGAATGAGDAQPNGVEQIDSTP